MFRFANARSLPIHHFPLFFLASCAPESKERCMQQFERASIVLVLGGVASGKSRFAQRLAEHWRRVAFIATAQCGDDEEMQRKIARHRFERPAHWITIEEPVSLGRVLQSAGSESDAILVDCLTLFSANLLEAHKDDNASLQAQIDSSARHSNHLLAPSYWSPMRWAAASCRLTPWPPIPRSGGRDQSARGEPRRHGAPDGRRHTPDCEEPRNGGKA